MKEKRSFAQSAFPVSADKKKPTPKEGAEPRHRSDYWDRITDDPASGYLNEESGEEDNLLNIDQEPGDNERGDTTKD